jgi:hypothetical protein
MKIILDKYLPLNNVESIQILLNDIEQCNYVYNEQDIGKVLIHIKKLKFQLFFKSGIDRINEQTKKALKNKRRKLALEQKKESQNYDAQNIVYTTKNGLDLTIKPGKPTKVAKFDETKDKKTKAKHLRNVPNRRLGSFFATESKKEKEKRRIIRERNAKTSSHLSPSILNEKGKSIIPIYIPMGGKPR